ncbi:hypothetical protein CASFOL_040578 [Castilleja foliolosa]|uniref:RING-type domain-containing protein n=1 Tax=Castilleja foliolosa TaxID=1961234 RepID=A0ABD3BCB5_9LAMI
MGGGDGGGAAGKLKKAAMKIFTLRTCGGSLCLSQQQQQIHVSRDSRYYSSSPCEINNIISPEITEQGNSSTSPSSNKSLLCTICLDPLSYNSGSKAIFTAQCSHAFHFACITSNVRHGSVTCPICRARWTQLPRNLNTRCLVHNTRDPVLQILDNSIDSSRVRRRSFFRSPQYDDMIERDHTGTDQPRLSFSLLTHPSNGGAYYDLRVKLAHQPATDLVLVVSLSRQTHSSLIMKQAMALVVSSMRPINRLAIVTCPSSPNARVCTLRRMTSHGKRIAIKLIDQISTHTSDAHVEDDPTWGLKEGAKILRGQANENLRSCILHLTDDPSRYNHHRFRFPITIYRFDVGACSEYLMREFEVFLVRTLGGRAEDIQMRVGEGENNVVVRIGEMRGGEERSIRLCGGGDDELGRVGVKYSYREGRDGECIRTGDVVVGIEKSKDGIIDSRNYCAGNWDYQDSFMSRRWNRD